MTGWESDRHRDVMHPGMAPALAKKRGYCRQPRRPTFEWADSSLAPEPYRVRYWCRTGHSATRIVVARGAEADTLPVISCRPFRSPARIFRAQVRNFPL